MAKHSTIQTIKFKRLVRELQLPEAHALGHLEMLWLHCHANESPVFENLDDVELAAGWVGEPGALASALVSGRWLDSREDGQYECHDYWEHAPYYVIERMRKRDQRRGHVQVCPGHVPDTSGTVPDKSRTCPGLSSPPTSTSTSTSTSTEIKIADKDSPLTRARARGGDPESLGCLSESAIDLSAQEAEWWGRVSWLVEDYALPWWQATMRAYLAAGGNGAELEELVRRYEDAASPAAREAKGIGGFAQRNGSARAFMKDMTRLCKRVGARWGKYPEEEA